MAAQAHALRQKFVELTQGLLLSLGMERGEVLCVTYNTLRRSLPSIGEAADFSGPEMQSLSNWSEKAKGAGGEGKVLRSTHPTSRTYAAGIFHSAAINRHKAVILAHMAAKALSISMADVKCNSISLQCIRRLRGQVEVAEAMALGGEPWAVPSSAKAPPQEMDLSKINSLAEAPVEDGEDIDSESSAASSSSSSSSSSGSDSTVAMATEEIPLLFRVREGGKVHLQHFIGAAGAVPYCRDSPFGATLLQENVVWMKTTSHWQQVCKSCRQRLPASLAKQLKHDCQA